MQLSKFSDYALRIVVHLAASPDRLLSARDIAEIHNAKTNHVAKVGSWLVAEGYAISVRGRGGGLRLSRAPAEINLGQLLRKLEEDKPLVECMGDGPSSCRLLPACGLSAALAVAQNAFFEALDAYTLDKVIATAPQMEALLQILNSAVEKDEPR